MQFSSFSGVRRKITIIGAFIIYAFKWNKSTCDSLLTLNDEDDRLGTKRTEVCETDVRDENRVNWTQIGNSPPLILMIIEFENGMTKCSLWTETRTSALVSIAGTKHRIKIWCGTDDKLSMRISRIKALFPILGSFGVKMSINLNTPGFYEVSKILSLCPRHYLEKHMLMTYGILYRIYSTLT